MKKLQSNLILKRKNARSTSYFQSKLHVERAGSLISDLSTSITASSLNLRLDPESSSITEDNIQLIMGGSDLLDFARNTPDTANVASLKLGTIQAHLEDYQAALSEYSTSKLFQKIIDGDYDGQVDLESFNNYYTERREVIVDDIFYLEIENQYGESFGKTYKLKPSEIDERYTSEISLPINDATTTSVKEGFNIGENVIIKYKNDYYNYSMTVNVDDYIVESKGQYIVYSLRFNANDKERFNEG